MSEQTTDVNHVAFATNDEYAPHLGASIASLLLNAHNNNNISIHVLHQSLSDSNMCNLMHLKRLRSNTHINLLKVCAEEFKCFPLLTGNHTVETYFRLRLPTILSEIDKVIYLDADTIVVNDIEKLWDEEIGDNLLLAVEEPRHLNKERLAELGMKDDSPYFNGGVLSINLAKMRTIGFEQKVDAYVHKKFRVLKYQDQDILNALSEECWSPLSLAYNSYSYVCDRRRENEFVFYTKDNAAQARKHPFIIHFNQHPKPWNPGCIDERRKCYWEYLKKTDFDVSKPDSMIGLTKFLLLKTFYYIKYYFPRCAKILSRILVVLRWPFKK